MVFLAGLISLAFLPWLAELSLFRKTILLLAWWVLIPLSIPLVIGESKIALAEVLLLFWIVIPVWRGVPGSFGKVLKHPVSILLAIEITIFFLSTLTSSMTAVSAKRAVLHNMFIVGAYFLFVPIFMETRNILKMGYLFSIGLIPVLIAGFTFMARFHFNSEVAPAATRPFFADHTEFGAFTAILFPFLFISWKYSRHLSLHLHLWQKLLVTVSLVGVIFSFSRAVWLSAAAAGVLYILILLGMRFRHLLIALLISGTILYQYSEPLYQVVLQNEANSSKQEVLEQLKSVGNVKTDVSNLERINRWKSAIRMFEEKPLFGFGPGTYQFQYAPFQELRDKTVISTNFGDAGNAHNEYLMYLSETGIFGFLTFISLCLYLTWLGFHLFRKGRTKATQYLALGILLGLTTLFIHSLFNSFLETDKIGLTFYLFAAGLVALDINNRHENVDQSIHLKRTEE